MQLHYWTGFSALNDKIKGELTEEIYKKLSLALESSVSVKLELIERYDDCEVYSMRITQKERLLLLRKANQEGGHQFIIFNVLRNHDYNGALSTFESGLLKAIQVRGSLPSISLDEELREVQEAFLNDLNSTLSTPVHERQTPLWGLTSRRVYQNGEVVVQPALLQLDQGQSEALSCPKPAIVSGPPGSGKSTIAHELALQLQALPEESRAIYITQNAKLAKQIEEEFKQMASPQLQGRIKFTTYEGLLPSEGWLKEEKSEDNTEEETAKSHCMNWLKRHYKFPKKTSAQQKESLIYRLYQEFRIRSGYDEQAYLDGSEVGKKQTLFTLEERSEVNALFVTYLAELQSEGRNHAMFSHYLEIEPQDLIIVDESQDLSNAQIRNLIHAAIENQITFLFGWGQNLHDDLANTLFIKHIFEGQVHEIALSRTYRCPNAIMDVADEVHGLMRSLTPNQKQTRTEAQTQSSGTEGQIGLWQNHEVDGFFEALHASYQAYPYDTCVIAEEGAHEELVARGIPQHSLYTPETIKGLEYGHVFIYEPFSDAIFSTIEKLMKNQQVDIQCSSPLNKFFVSLTRATIECQILNTKHHSQLKDFLATAIKVVHECYASSNSIPIEVQALTPESLKVQCAERALKLVSEGEIKRAQLILEEAQLFNQSEINQILNNKNKIVQTEPHQITTDIESTVKRKVKKRTSNAERNAKKNAKKKAKRKLKSSKSLLFIVEQVLAAQAQLWLS